MGTTNNSFVMDEMEPMARPLLPMFFVLDTSGSMGSNYAGGTPISILNHAMEEVADILKNFAASNADALLKIGVLQVHSGCHWIQPNGLEELEDFIYTPLTAGGLTDMGAALSELDQKLSRKEFLYSTTGRCKPIIIFMTDGQPTDDWENPLKKLKDGNRWYQNSIKIGFAVGDNANCETLSKIVGNSEAVIQTSDLAIFSGMLQKVAINSAMIGSKSHVTEDSADGAQIVHDVVEGEKSAQTAKDKGIVYKEPESASSSQTSKVPDPWGDDWK